MGELEEQSTMLGRELEEAKARIVQLNGALKEAQAAGGRGVKHAGEQAASERARLLEAELGRARSEAESERRKYAALLDQIKKARQQAMKGKSKR